MNPPKQEKRSINDRFPWNVKDIGDKPFEKIKDNIVIKGETTAKEPEKKK